MDGAEGSNGFSHDSATKSWFYFPDFAGLRILSGFKEDVSARNKVLLLSYSREAPFGGASQCLVLRARQDVKEERRPARC